MGTYRRNYFIMTSAMIVETIISQLIITLTCASIEIESNLYTPSTISTKLSQNISRHVTQKEFRAILHQFHEVEEDLKTLDVTFCLQSKENKSQEINSKLPECTTSHYVLTNLKNFIGKKLSLVTSGSNSSACTLNINDFDNCTALIKVIQCGFKNFKDGFIDATTSGIDSIDESVKWKNVYKNLFEIYDKLSANLKRSLLHEYQLAFDDKIQADLQKGKALSKPLECLQTSAINICISEIMRGEDLLAVDYFQKFDLNSLSLSTIIKQSYNLTNDLRNFETIINFIEGQQQNTTVKIPNDIIAYQTLYNEMELKNHLNSSKIILLALAIENSPAKNELTSLYPKIEYHFNKFKYSWTAKIYNNRHDNELTNFDYNWNRYFQEILSDIFKKVLKMPNALTDNFNNILKFIRNELQYIDDPAIAFSTIFNEIKTQRMVNNFAGMSKLAYLVKEFMEMPNYPDIGEKFKKMYDDVKLNIPSWAYKLIWQGDQCQLRNRNGGELLYVAGEELAYDAQRRRVFSGQESFLKGNTEAESQWKFETEDKGESFMIKIHGHWKEYLYAYKNAYDDGPREPRQVFTGRPLIPQRAWKITPTGNGTYVTVESIYNRNEYLYIDNGNNNLKSRVFTRRLGAPLTSSDEWQLLCDINTKN